MQISADNLAVFLSNSADYHCLTLYHCFVAYFHCFTYITYESFCTFIKHMKHIIPLVNKMFAGYFRLKSVSQQNFPTPE